MAFQTRRMKCAFVRLILNGARFGGFDNLLPSCTSKHVYSCVIIIKTSKQPTITLAQAATKRFTSAFKMLAFVLLIGHKIQCKEH